MDVDMWRTAMEAMDKMTPQQMAAMQQQMSSIPPSVMQEQMRRFHQLTPEQKKQAAEQAKNIDPATISAQTSHMAEVSGWKVLKDAENLKAEGNRHHGLGQYAEAAEKYELASSKVQSLSSTAAQTLATACKLNLSSCYLHLGQLEQCVRVCTEIISKDHRNLKARYRRGQAYLAQQHFDAAVKDLTAAFELAPADQKEIIHAKLQIAQQGLDSSATDQVGQQPTGMEPVVEEPQSPSGVPPASSDEEIAASDPTQPIAQTETAGATPVPPFQGMDGPAIATQMRGLAEMMRLDPSFKQSMQDMAATMPLDANIAGSRLTPEMARQAMGQIGSMTNEQLEGMARLLESHPGILQNSAGPGGVAPLANAPTSPYETASAAGQDGNAGAGMAALMQNPDLMQQAMRMMTSTPMANSMQGGLHPDQIQAMMGNPDTIKTVQNMMSNLSAQDLAAISRQAGFSITESQAEVMATQMQKMSPDQIAKLMKLSQLLQRVKTFILSHMALALAILLLCVAIIYKCFAG